MLHVSHPPPTSRIRILNRLLALMCVQVQVSVVWPLLLDWLVQVWRWRWWRRMSLVADGVVWSKRMAFDLIVVQVCDWTWFRLWSWSKKEDLGSSSFESYSFFFFFKKKTPTPLWFDLILLSIGFYLMPEVFDDLFDDLGEKVKDWYELKKCEPNYMLSVMTLLQIS